MVTVSPIKMTVNIIHHNKKKRGRREDWTGWQNEEMTRTLRGVAVPVDMGDVRHGLLSHWLKAL